MDYIVERSGGLESFEMSNCFMVTDPRVTARGRPSIEQLFLDFQANLLRLFRKNVETLKTFILRVNQFQEVFLGNVARIMTGRMISEMKLALVQDDYSGVTALLHGLAGLEKLSLDFRGLVTSEQVEAALQGLEGSLRKFELIIYGDKLGEELTLSLDQFLHLESVKVSDDKVLFLF